MHCKTCAFYNDNDSECRRYAPQPTGEDKTASWPQVAQTDWCGEYQAESDAKKTA